MGEAATLVVWKPLQTSSSQVLPIRSEADRLLPLQNAGHRVEARLNLPKYELYFWVSEDRNVQGHGRG